MDVEHEDLRDHNRDDEKIGKIKFLQNTGLHWVPNIFLMKLGNEALLEVTKREPETYMERELMCSEMRWAICCIFWKAGKMTEVGATTHAETQRAEECGCPKTQRPAFCQDHVHKDPRQPASWRAVREDFDSVDRHKQIHILEN